MNKKTFDQAVLLNSHKIPVLVEFMAVCSGSCMAMEHVFTELAKEFSEQYIFALVMSFIYDLLRLRIKI